MHGPCCCWAHAERMHAHNCRVRAALTAHLHCGWIQSCSCCCCCLRVLRCCWFPLGLRRTAARPACFCRRGLYAQRHSSGSPTRACGNPPSCLCMQSRFVDGGCTAGACVNHPTRPFAARPFGYCCCGAPALGPGSQPAAARGALNAAWTDATPWERLAARMLQGSSAGGTTHLSLQWEHQTGQGVGAGRGGVWGGSARRLHRRVQLRAHQGKDRSGPCLGVGGMLLTSLNFCR